MVPYGMFFNGITNINKYSTCINRILTNGVPYLPRH